MFRFFACIICLASAGIESKEYQEALKRNADHEREIEEMEHEEDISEDSLREEFNRFDANKDNLLDAADIRATLKGAFDTTLLFGYFVESDLDESGTITFDEFVKARRQRYAKSTPKTGSN